MKKLFFILLVTVLVTSCDWWKPIEENHPPVIHCTVTSATVPVGVPINLWYSLSDLDGDFLSAKLVLGDGRVIPAGSTVVSWTYLYLGTYNARLIVTDGKTETVWPMTFYVVY